MMTTVYTNAIRSRSDERTTLGEVLDRHAVSNPAATARSQFQIGGYLAINRTDGLRVVVINIPHPDGGGQDVAEVLEPYAEKFVQAVNSFDALVEVLATAESLNNLQHTGISAEEMADAWADLYAQCQKARAALVQPQR